LRFWKSTSAIAARTAAARASSSRRRAPKRWKKSSNLLPASVKTVCVDINPAVVTKLTDRGTFQAMGLVTDVEPFLRELCQYLN